MEYSKNFLKELYSMMLRIRLAEESLVEPILKGEIKCPVHLYTGEEAVATGVCSNLNKNDYAFGNHRSHGHYLAKGGSIKELVAEVFGKETGCSKGRGGSMHVIDVKNGFMGAAPIVAGTISLGVGAALASKIRKDKKISVAFFGDGATDEGVFYESLNFAAIEKLPVIFACENNLYSTHLPIKECRAETNISKVASSIGVKSFRVDGNNVLKVLETSKKAIDFCRKGKGPVFIEFLTYRMRGHVGPDDNVQGTHTDIRPKKEFEQWRKKDPIKKFEKYLLKKKVLNAKEMETIKNKIRKEVESAHKLAKQAPYPREKDLCKYVFKK